MNDRIYIIAGTHIEYDKWVHANIARFYKQNTSITYSSFVYVNSIDNLRGVRDIHGFFIGSFRQRKDLNEIITTLCIANNLPYNHKFF